MPQISPDAFEEMLRLQDEINCRIRDDWREQGNEWYRAIWLECAELLEHWDWKWWKRQRVDWAQLRMEVVDIWHFGLSDLLQDADVAAAANAAAAGFAAAPASLTLPEAVENLAGLSLRERRFSAPAFHALMRAAQMDFSELRQLYVGKNALNFFRQANGYLEGNYRKVWGDMEDNEHLSEILVELPANAPADDIHQALQERYTRIFKAS